MKKKFLVALMSIMMLISLTAVIVFAADGTSTVSDELSDITIIDTTTEWRYLDDNTDPAAGLDSLTAWTAPDFDDSSWKSGIGSFGCKRGQMATINGYTPNVVLDFYLPDGSGKAIPTYFFRTTFNVANASSYNKLVFTAAADDSLAIYVNGVKVGDTRLTSNSSTNLFYSEGETYTNFTYCFNEGFNPLRDGENTVAVQVHNCTKDSSDVYFEVTEMVLTYEELPPAALAEQIVISFGNNETERNLAWFSTEAAAGEVRLAEASKVVNGVFPSEYTSFGATSKASTVQSGKYSKKATLTGLVENTRYAYVIEADGYVSDIHYFNVGSFDEFGFVYIADAQIQKTSQAPLWNYALDKITGNLDADLLISGGDQVTAPDDSDLYGVFITEALSGITFAPTNGPGHDSSGALYSEHYNLPNLSASYGVSTTTSNYWYAYNNVLFIHLNSEDTYDFTNGGHASFIREAKAANPDVDWTIVVTHFSFFSTGKHSGGYIGEYRNGLAEDITALGVDVVLSGHDHVYTRSKMMDGLTPAENNLIIGNTAYSPKGTLYVCSNSCTGTKYYDQAVFDGDFVAKDSYNRTTAVKFEVTENSISMTSYYLDDMTVFDTFTIDKRLPDDIEPELTLEGVDVTLTDGILLNFYISSSVYLDKVDNAELVTKNGKDCYKVTVDVAAKEMGDNVTVQLIVDGKELGDSFTFSVKEYAEGILNGNYDAETKALVRAMLNYGAAAQSYFGYKTDALVGTPVTDLSKLNAANVAAPLVSDADRIFIGASLVLEGKMKLRFYFYGNDRSVTVDGKSVSVVNASGYCYAEISVTPADIDKTCEVKSGSTTVKYSALNYLKNNSDNASLSLVVASIYDYSAAAKSYRVANYTPLEHLQREDISVYEYPLDQLVEVIGTVAYNTDDSKIYNYYVYNDGKTISYLIDITDTTFDSIRIELADHDNPYLRFAFLAEMPVMNQPVKYADGYCTYKAAWINDFTLDIPSDAKYLIMAKMDGSYDCTPAKMTFVKGTTALENVQNEELDVYEYPMENLVFDHGMIDYTGGNTFTSSGSKKIAIIDITDCAFDYVSMTIDSSFKNKSIRYTFLAELPQWKETVVYADGYSTFMQSDKGASITNIEIPENAKYLVVWYMESYYDGTSSSDSRYYPETITFHNEEK